MTRERYTWFGRLLVVTLAYAALSGAPSDRPQKGEWWYYAADLASTKYSPLEQINRANVSKLRVAWRRPQIDPAFAAAYPNLRLTPRAPFNCPDRWAAPTGRARRSTRI